MCKRKVLHKTLNRWRIKEKIQDIWKFEKRKIRQGNFLKFIWKLKEWKIAKFLEDSFTKKKKYKVFKVGRESTIESLAKVKKRE
jgi:hypothetical protein